MGDITINKRRRWWLAGLLSFFVPGLGQVYNGQETKGLFFYVVYFVWGGFLISLVYYLLKLPITPMDIGVICLLALVSLILLILIIFESIRTASRISSDYTLKRYNRWYIYLLVILIIRLVDFSVETAVVKNTIVKAYKIPSGAMMPTLLIGDHFTRIGIYYDKVFRSAKFCFHTTLQRGTLCGYRDFCIPVFFLFHLNSVPVGCVFTPATAVGV